MFGKRKTDVVISGGGPAGLLTALVLAERGVEVRVLDKERRSGRHHYALALHPRSLRLLDDLGLADGLVESGRRITTLAYYDGTERRFELSLKEIGGKFPFLLVVPQRALEDALEERVRRARVKVLWNHRLQDFSVRPDGVEVEIAELDQVSSGYPIARLEWVVNKVFPMHASYLVGADGYHSMVRDRLGIEYASHGDFEHYAVFEFDSDTDVADELRVVLTDGKTSVLWPQRGRRFRWTFQIDGDRIEGSPPDHLNELIRQRAHWFPEVRGELYWSSVVKFDRRLATGFGVGRTWLVGDAAHLTGPAGNQSMNAGLVDAQALGVRLAQVLRDDGSVELLEAYGEERLAEWKLLLGLVGPPALTDDGEEWLRPQAGSFVTSIPATGDDLAALLKQAGFSYQGVAAR